MRAERSHGAGRIQYIASHEDFTVTDAAAHRIAVLSDGGMRDALSLLDQCAAVSDEIGTETVEEAVGVAGTESVFEVLRAVAAHDAAAALERIDLLYRQSKDMTRFADEISAQLRCIMLLKTAPDSAALPDIMPGDLEALRALSGQMTLGAVLEALSAVRACCDRMTRAGNRRMELEMTLIRLCSDLRTQQGDVSALTERISALEAALEALRQNGIPAQSAAAARPQRQHSAPAQNLQVQGKTDTAQYTPVRDWQSVLEHFHEVNPSVSGLLQGSEAYVIEDKNILLMIVRSRLFKELFTAKDAATLGAAAQKVLGKKFAIRYKCVESEEEKTAPADVLLSRARTQGIEVTEQNHP